MKRLFLVVALCIMAWVFWQQKTVVKSTKKPSIEAQEYMHSITMTSYNADGSVKQMIEAESWEFLPQEKKSNVYHPHVVVYKPNGDIWDITSNTAYAWQNTLQDKVENVELRDHVVMQRANNSKYTPTTIKSSAIDYYPQQAKITSNVQVMLNQPDLYISGIGMLGHLDKNWLKLYDRTTTIHDHHIINAKEVEFDNDSGTALYTTNVVVSNNESNLRSDTLKLIRDGENNRIKTMIAYGKPAIYTKQGDSIEGPVLTYDVAQETLHTQKSTVILQPKQEN